MLRFSGSQLPAASRKISEVESETEERFSESGILDMLDVSELLSWSTEVGSSFKSVIICIYFTYRYFRDFGPGWGIREGLILHFFWCFIAINSHILKQKFLRGPTREICENKTTAKITTYTVYLSLMTDIFISYKHNSTYIVIGVHFVHVFLFQQF